MPEKSAKYKVELTGHTRYFSVDDEKGNEYTVVEEYNANPDWTERTIYNKEGEIVDDEQLKNKIIEAVLSR